MSYADAMLMLPCHECGADPGGQCRTFMPYTRPPGAPTQPHASRHYQVSDILDATGYPEDLRAEWRHRRAVDNAIRDLHKSLDGFDSVNTAWLRVRLSELLAVRG